MKDKRTKQIRIKIDAYNRLIARAHHDQAINGIIMDLLDLADKIEGKEKTPLAEIKGCMPEVKELEQTTQQ